MPLPENIKPRIPSDVGEGWIPIVQKLEEDLRALDPEYEILQVKEKFGALRFYFKRNNASEKTWAKMRTLVLEAEYKSTRTCEVCGQPGVLREGDWLKTLCDKHGEGRPEAESMKDIAAKWEAGNVPDEPEED